MSGLVEKIESLTGGEVVPTDDLSVVKKNIHPEDGTTIKTEILYLRSDDALIYDIMQMDRKPTIVDKEILDQTVYDTLRNTLRYCINLVKKEYLERLFPGLSVDNLESYDFRLSRMKVVVLETNDFSNFYNDLYGSPSLKTAGSSLLPYASYNDVGYVDLSENPLMLLREMDLPTQDLLVEKGPYPRKLNKEDENIVIVPLKSTVTHELLHMLDVARFYPHLFRESITEWYNQMITRRSIDDEQKKYLIKGYPENLQALDILIGSLKEEGLTNSDIDNAFISNDTDSMDKIKETLIRRYGERDTERILNWDFSTKDNNSGALNGILRIEQKRKNKESGFNYETA